MAGEIEAKKKEQQSQAKREIPQVSSALFFQANTALGPPYHVLVDTNFLSHTVQAKLELEKALMDLLYAKATPIITSCVMAELEKLGPKYRIALRIARDERWERLKCDHKGTYADDCIVDRVQKHRIYLVATNDRYVLVYGTGWAHTDFMQGPEAQNKEDTRCSNRQRSKGEVRH